MQFINSSTVVINSHQLIKSYLQLQKRLSKVCQTLAWWAVSYIKTVQPMSPGHDMVRQLCIHVDLLLDKRNMLEPPAKQWLDFEMLFTSQQLLKWTCSIECGHGHPGTASSTWGYCFALHAANLSCCSKQYAYNDSWRSWLQWVLAS